MVSFIHLVEASNNKLLLFLLFLGDSNDKNVIQRTGLSDYNTIDSNKCQDITSNLNVNPSKTCSDKSPEHSVSKHSKNTTNLMVGLGGMSSLLDKGPNDGIIMKCNSFSLKSKSRPTSLSIKSPKKTCEITNVSDLSLLKTLRKGGFV